MCSPIVFFSANCELPLSPSLLLLQNCCTHDREFIENVKYECGDDQYLDEEFLYILHEYSTQKERQTNCHDIQEISRQLVLSSLTEVDIDQSSDSTSYISLPEIDDDLQHSCLSLCDQERGWDFQSDPSSYYSTFKFLLQEEASPSQSENSFSQLQYLESYNACVIDYTKMIILKNLSLVVPPHVHFLKMQVKRNHILK